MLTWTRGTLSFSGEAVDKFMDHLRTGAPQVFHPGEILSFTSDFDFLRPMRSQETGASLHVKAKPMAAPLPMRVPLGADEQAAVYECILFKCTQAGTHEGTFESTGAIPFRMTVVLRTDGTGIVDFQDASAGYGVHEVQKYLRGIISAIATGAFELYDLTRGEIFLRPKLSATLPQWAIPYASLIDDAVLVADKFNASLISNGVPTKGDANTLQILKRLHEGVPLPIGEIRLGITKIADPPHKTRIRPEEEQSFRITAPSLYMPLKVFGTEIVTGPVQYDIRGRIGDATAFNEFFDHAIPGEHGDITIVPSELIVRSLAAIVAPAE